MKKVMALILVLVMCLSLCACGGGSGKKEQSLESFACGYAAAFAGSNPSKLRDYMHEAFYNSYAREMREDGGNLVWGYKVISTKVVNIRKVDSEEYQERIAIYWDIYEDVVEAYYVDIEIVIECVYDGKKVVRTEDPTVEIAKIDGKWYGFKIH